ncbi:hypothetical protein F511_06570 [Dorcoceras hygrometricum]|uniref:Uncharacterized protein n=1 Tax=Dorcoceras hygrometricum TaxID=472368 RepID=A0A2Z7B6D9_9LAMI|nr:hypothetical protein F511_06570 [Dorcoceras hygrometricum]
MLATADCSPTSCSTAVRSDVVFSLSQHFAQQLVHLHCNSWEEVLSTGCPDAVLLVQPDEGVLDLVVDRIGDNLPQSTEKSRILVIPVGARHKCQQGPNKIQKTKKVATGCRKTPGGGRTAVAVGNAQRAAAAARRPQLVRRRGAQPRACLAHHDAWPCASTRPPRNRLRVVAGHVRPPCTASARDAGFRRTRRPAAVDRQSGPRPEVRILRQPALEGLKNSTRTESPRRGDRNKSDHEAAARAAAGGGAWLSAAA